MSDHDCIVVGAGTAGSVVARRLADAGWSVLVVEAGGSNRDERIQDVGRLNQLWHSPLDWDHHSEPQPYAQGRRLHLPRGKVLGGSHSLNAAIWVRGLPSDFDGWAAEGCPGWSWEQLEPVYRRIEDWRGQPAAGRGRAGLLPVEQTAPLHPVQAAILEAGVQWGMARNPDYNSGTITGIAPMQLTVAHGERVTTWDAYTQPAVDEGRIALRTGAVVRRVLVHDGRAVAVELHGPEGTQAVAARQIVLCAGAFGSAEILLRSGIGPARQLAALGIEPHADLPVGRNLHDHYLVPVVFSARRPVEPPLPRQPVTQVHWFWSSVPEAPAPDTQPLAFSVPMLEPDMEPVPNGFTLMAGLVGTHSRGELTLGGPQAADGIRIDPHVLEDERDVASLLRSVRQCLQLGAQPALAAWGAQPVHPGDGLSDEELVAYIRRRVTTYHHPVGTCRMGSDARAVVDPRLRVRGVAGLTVADASVMPAITTGNTNAPTTLIAEQAAGFLLDPASAPAPAPAAS